VNRGCFLHTAKAEDGSRVVFFEKRTSLEREINFCTHLAGPYLADAVPIIPRIYGIDRRKTDASIFMDFVENVGLDFRRSDAEARALAKAIARISEAPVEQVPQGANRISPTLVEQFRATVERENLLDGASSERRRLFHECVDSASEITSRVAARVPLIPSHNDIYIPNMALLADGESPAFCFVDWGKYSLNFAGADWQHFQFEAFFRRQNRDFLQCAYEAYVSLMRDRGFDIDVEDVRFSATHYTLQRTMSRLLNRPSGKWLQRALQLFKQARRKSRRKPQSNNPPVVSSRKQEPMSDLRREADRAVAAKDWNKAAELWQLLLDRSPNDVTAYVRLARALRQIGDFDRADAILRQGEAVKPGNERLERERDALEQKRQKSKAKAPGNVYHGKTALTYHNRRKDSVRWRAEDKAVATLLSDLPEGISVIDLPFGTGRFTDLYVERKIQITGVDISADMLGAAREIYGAALADAKLEVGDATSLQYTDNEFDLVVSVRFLQNIIPYGMVKLALKEMARVTKSWGIFEFEIRKDGAVDAGLPGEDEPIRGLLYEEQVGALLETAGFTLKRVIPVYDNGPSNYCIVLCDVVRSAP
jgi:predicted TPR repeat methyltransferase